MGSLMSGMRAFAFGQDGQSLVEIALCLPVLLLIVVGIVDIGRVYSYKAAISNAAREAAIYAARDPQAPLDAICQRARDELGAGTAGTPCATNPIVVTCQRAGASCGNDPALPIYQANGASAATVTVTVRYDLQLLTGYLVGRAFTTNPVHIFGSAAFDGLGQ